MTAFLRSTFASPELMASFVRTLSPELTGEIVNQIVPQLTAATSAATTAAASEALIAYQRDAATNAMANGLMNQITRVGAQAAITAVASYFGAPAPTNLLTNGGRRNRSKSHSKSSKKMRKFTKKMSKKPIYGGKRRSTKTKKNTQTQKYVNKIKTK